jgi:uncharacterized membrane protein
MEAQMSDRSSQAGLAGERHRDADAGAADDAVAPVVARNIRALCRRRERDAKAARPHDRIIAAITAFVGTPQFIYLHVAIIAIWIACDRGWIPMLPPWDLSFAVLASMASVEAIFLSAFVLITQNSMAAAADKRSDLDLQISLLAEHELTQIAGIVYDIAEALNIDAGSRREIEQVKADVAPEAVLDRIEAEQS